jgi:hypothetical protein
MIKSLWHWLFDRKCNHNWMARGWTSFFFAPEECPVGFLGHYYECSRCHKKEITFESLDDVQKRFDGYRNKYGDAIVETDEFDPPKPLK